MNTSVAGLRYGQLVQSLAGRDINGDYLIIDFPDEHSIRVVDGDKHPITRPKKKNLKHVKITMAVAKEIEELIMQGKNISDAQVFAAINRLKTQLEEGDRFHG